jgi:circadian clock protein KaiC
MPTASTPPALRKCPTGIQGLDEITGGGLPLGRPSLVCGAAGSGKTLLAMEFLVRGVTEFGEPGVFMAFEENAQDLTENFASLGFDLPALQAEKKLAIDYVFVERAEIQETGEYDLEGLFVRLGYALDSVGAKRVVLDTIESLFAGFNNENILRAELRRLFRWLKDRGVTAIITGESGEEALTRQGLEEYVSDCVIVLDNRVARQLSTRRLRIVKYRGSAHGTNEYPFIIGAHGLSVLPITSVGLFHHATTERVPTGFPGLDEMLGGQGFYRGSSVLVSGTAGTGKSTIAATLAAAACGRGERCLYFAFEESPQQIVRNMRSIGLDLQPSVDKGLLQFHAARATTMGLESHLLALADSLAAFQPHKVVFDPITNLLTMGSPEEVKSMLTRVIDTLKLQEITAVFTSLVHGEMAEASEAQISSLMDTWILLRILESDGERSRGLYVLKSRGMAHSNQVREFLISDEGLALREVYVGPGLVLAGSARLAQEARDAAEAEYRREEIASRRRELESKRALLEGRITALRAEFEADEEEVRKLLVRAETAEKAAGEARAAMKSARG